MGNHWPLQISTYRKVRNDGNPLWGSKPRQSLPPVSLQLGFKFFVPILPLGGLARVEGDEGHWTLTPLGVPACYDSNL